MKVRTNMILHQPVTSWGSFFVETHGTSSFGQQLSNKTPKCPNLLPKWWPMLSTAEATFLRLGKGKKLSRSHCHANRIWPWKCMLGLLAAVHKPPGNNVVGGVSSLQNEGNTSGKLSNESSNMNNNDQQWEAHDTHNIISTMDLYLLFSTIRPWALGTSSHAPNCSRGVLSCAATWAATVQHEIGSRMAGAVVPVCFFRYSKGGNDLRSQVWTAKFGELGLLAMLRLA